jgi:hypothetical protein
MPTLQELLDQLKFITYETALLGLFITAGIILIMRDWRFLILTLLVQYILEGIILLRLVRPDIAVLEVLIGAFICPILFLSARQVSASALPASIFIDYQQDYHQRKLVRWWRNLVSKWRIRGIRRSQPVAATGFTFRIFIGLLMILVTLTLSSTFPLPDLPGSVTTAVYWLVLAGLTVLMLTENPMKAGHGLLTTLTGFSLFYFSLERSLLLTGLWGTVNLLIALAIGYLTVVKGAIPEEEM